MRTQVDVLASDLRGRLVWRVHVLPARRRLLQCTDGKCSPLRDGAWQAAVALGSLSSASHRCLFLRFLPLRMDGQDHQAHALPALGHAPHRTRDVCCRLSCPHAGCVA